MKHLLVLVLSLLVPKYRGVLAGWEGVTGKKALDSEYVTVKN